MHRVEGFIDSPVVSLGRRGANVEHCVEGVDGVVDVEGVDGPMRIHPCSATDCPPFRTLAPRVWSEASLRHECGQKLHGPAAAAALAPVEFLNQWWRAKRPFASFATVT